MKQTKFKNAKALKLPDKRGDKSTLTTGLPNPKCRTAITARKKIQWLEINFKEQIPLRYLGVFVVLRIHWQYNTDMLDISSIFIFKVLQEQ